MLFAVIENKPYLLNGDKAVMVKIEGDNVTIIGKKKIKADSKKRAYSLQELRACFPGILAADNAEDVGNSREE